MSDILRPSLLSLGTLPVFLPLEVPGPVLTCLGGWGLWPDSGGSSRRSCFRVAQEGPGTPSTFWLLLGLREQRTRLLAACEDSTLLDFLSI